MAKKDPHNKKVSFTIAMTFFERGALDYIAKKSGMNRSEYVTKAVLEDMERNYEKLLVNKACIGPDDVDESMTPEVFALILKSIRKSMVDRRMSKTKAFSDKAIAYVDLNECINACFDDEEGPTMK